MNMAVKCKTHAVSLPWLFGLVFIACPGALDGRKHDIKLVLPFGKTRGCFFADVTYIVDQKSVAKQQQTTHIQHTHRVDVLILEVYE